ncbi:hypothetical protein [Streptomyces acidiscabies]|uniref:Uncharacterized protein n=1 Tax=Streptomyces acidiscabies TaxID=42234 RepID=A0AAP6BEG8_9ACTN|nr:hypothetical protein [Streptomyces acidiscabies]MDX2963268.1 hypothetical protein [Streptomyces acidiscabies]MDX3021514.1 hypothetical protein [Streptomyces acidiscabies]MDX3790273.1 hypothetical protein [Streptomyces acidiscabies]GAQ57412.1 hypothetical protein a10_07282 [Streptomyces acidiscabies]
MLVLLVGVGGPWMQSPLNDYFVEHYHEGGFQRWLAMAAYAPSWQVDPDDIGGTGYLVSNNLLTLLMFLGILLLPARLPARLPGWLRCLVGSVLAVELMYLALWLVPELFAANSSDNRFNETVLKDFARSGLIFGLAAGIVLALLTKGSPGTRTAVSARRVRALSSLRTRQGVGVRNAVPMSMPLGRTKGDVTRYLCAAAYTDENFARRVVDEVLADEASAVAPSPDVDLVAVSLHCLHAEKLRHARDLRLSVAFGAIALVAPLWLIPAGMYLGLVQRPVQPSLSTRGRHHPDSKVLWAAVVSAGVIALVTLYFAVLLSSAPLPGFFAWLLGAYAGGVPAALVSFGAAASAYAIVVQHETQIDQLLRSTMTRQTFGSAPPPAPPRKDWVTRRLAAIGEAQNGNVTIYSGYAPWMGYAATVSKYPLTVPLLAADDPTGTGRPLETTPFTVTELIAHVRRRIQATAGEEALGSLTIEDRVFVNGTTLTDDERFMRANTLVPVTRLSAEEVEQIMLRPTGHVRHYLAVHVPLWGGDVVPSVLLHFSTASQTLQLHIDNHVMSPVFASYHAVDRLRGAGLGADARRGVLVNAIGRTGGALLAAPSRARHHAQFEKLHSRRMDDELKAMEQDPGYDYGARVSVREMALDPQYQNYFQVLDAERVTALIQRHTFAAIREFLDAHGYDTTDFRAQQQTILNQGVIQQGGTSIVGNQAVGPNATALQGIPKQQSGGAAAPSPARGAAK